MPTSPAGLIPFLLFLVACPAVDESPPDLARPTDIDEEPAEPRRHPGQKPRQGVDEYAAQAEDRSHPLWFVPRAR